LGLLLRLFVEPWAGGAWECYLAGSEFGMKPLGVVRKLALAEFVVLRETVQESRLKVKSDQSQNAWMRAVASAC
jgi:hypothetical protein